MATSIQHCYYNIPITFAHHQTLNKTDLSPKFCKGSIKSSPRKEICKKGNLKEAFASLTALSSDDGIYRLVKPEEVYAPILELCATKKVVVQGQQIHARLIKSNLELDSVFLSTKLVFMYCKCGSILDAEKVFDQMHERTIFTWNAMIGAYASNGESLRALDLYRRMRVSGVPFDSFTFPCVLKACGVVEDIHCGAEIHGLIIKCGYDSIMHVANSLVAMYAKSRDIIGARTLFDGMNERNDVVSWNSIISAYSMDRQCMEALKLFSDMQNAGVGMNTCTFVAALQACENSSLKKLGMEIHAAILKSSPVLDVYVANALVAMYVRFGKMSDAARIFEKLDDKDSITWNSILPVFTQNGPYNEALQFFCGLQNANLKPDEVFPIIIPAVSGRLGYLLNRKEVHAYAMKNWLDSNLRI